MNWTSLDTWIFVTAALCAVACALPGCFLVLRKMSMMGDAITHAVLPGLAIGFILTGTRASWPMFLGAILVGLLTALFTQWISRLGRVDRGAAMGVVFTTLFAIGLILIQVAAHEVELDPSCVLYGALEFTPLDRISIRGWEVPRAAAVLAAVLVVNALLILALFKEFRLSAFDPALAETLGYRPNFMHYLLMAMVAITSVAAFEAVGSIIVIAMFVAPAATGLLLTRSLPLLLLLACGFGILAAGLGVMGALTLPPMLGFKSTSVSGMMAGASGLLFLLAWAYNLLSKGRASRTLHSDSLVSQRVSES